MRRYAILRLLLALLLTAELGVAGALAQGTGGEIVVAQQDRPNIFRFLFGNRRREAPPPFFELPRVVVPERQAPRARRERRERRARPAAPVVREVAAVEKAADAKRVLVVGDFMAGALAKGLAETYRENPNVVVVDASNGSSGLVRDDFYDWPGAIPKLAEEQKPDVILAMIGANDRQTLRTDQGSLALGSDEWRNAYALRATAFADALKATTKPVLWVGLTPVSSSTMSRDYSAFNGMVRERLESKGIRYIETWNGFADEEGKYVAVGPDVGGQSVQLRASDGLNFTKAGQRKLAFFVEQELNSILGGAASALAAVDPATGLGTGGIGDPLVGPMLPLDALSMGTGDELSGAAAAKESGIAATLITKRLTGEEKGASPPVGRADNYTWPPPAVPVSAVPEPIVSPGTPASH